MNDIRNAPRAGRLPKLLLPKLSLPKLSLAGFLRDRRGVTSLEYGILAAGLALAIGALVATDGKLVTAMNNVFAQVVKNVPTSADAPAAPPAGQQ